MQNDLISIFMPLAMMLLVACVISVLDTHWIWGIVNMAFFAVICAVHIVPQTSHALDAA